MERNNEFLLKEYELCFKQLQFYDNRHSSTLKYLLTLTTSVATAQFALLKFINGDLAIFFKAQAVLSTVVFIASSILFLVMLQNRVYFSKIANQINSLRSYFCKYQPDFINKLWETTTTTSFNIFSVHTFQMLGAIIITSIFGSNAIYAALYICCIDSIWLITGLSFVGLIIILSLIGIIYLKMQKMED